MKFGGVWEEGEERDESGRSWEGGGDVLELRG